MSLRDITFEILPILAEEIRTETVERKGIGHPDSIADGIAESCSRKYSNYCLERFGKIPHHNFDKVLACAGRTKKKWGGGKVIKPFKIYVSGQGVKEVGGERIPLKRIVKEATEDHLRNTLSNYKPSHSEVKTEIERGSSDLIDLYDRELKSNDSSFGVGYYPYTKTEELVFRVEKTLLGLRKNNPGIGEDIKIAASRIDDKIDLTIACATIDRYLSSFNEYLDLREKVKREVMNHANQRVENIRVDINTADDLETKSIGGVYATVIGTSLENGDNGQTGRGNGISGLSKEAWPRPDSKEAVCGKNPVNHVGKLYQLSANFASKEIVEETAADEAQVILFAKIGEPITEPSARVKYRPEGVNKNEISRIVSYWCNQGLNEIRQKLIKGEINHMPYSPSSMFLQI